MRFIPEWFPFAYFKRQAEIWKGDYLALVNTPFNDAKRKFVRYPLCDDKLCKLKFDVMMIGEGCSCRLLHFEMVTDGLG